MRLLCFGDSITQGFWSVEGGWVELLRKHFDKKSLENLNDDREPVVFNMGVSGDQSINLLKRIRSETEARIWENDSLYLVISVGLNDAVLVGGERQVSESEYQENLEKIIESVKPIAKDILLVGLTSCDETLTNPVYWGDYSYKNKDIENLEIIMEQVATKYSYKFVPMYRRFKELSANDAILLEDGLHPNSKGHEFIFHTLLDPIREMVGLLP